jgi:predicted AlkP superfamily phosphohydrolase/phosphomutase/tetratricopeptide (TPR) repeat protein
MLLIGWDAGDWNVARPLMEAGKMPNLQKLCDEGVWGNLATIRPVLSPMLWTSIATGKRAWKHGIHGFSEPCPSSGAIRPITNLSRKTKAVWNIFNQQGWQSNVIGWWPSSPAEPINGVMVSNHFQQAGFNLDQDWPLRPGTVHPQRLEEPLKEMRVHPAELGNEHILPFIPQAAEIDQEQDKRMEGCAKTIAEVTGIHAAATACMQLEPWDFMAVYYDGIDHFGHGFMKFHPPRQPWVDEKEFELYKHVIEAGYQYHDMMLGALLHLAGEEATVMLVSDHGFEPGQLRPKSLPNEPAGPAAEHSPYGIFCLKGPGVKRGEQIYGASLLDITPTLLHLYGLPVGQDMDGKVLVNCFEENQSVDFIPSWDEVAGDDGRHPAGKGLEAVESRESLRQLIDLGYIEEPNPDQGKAIDETIRELQYNLAQAYMDGGLLSQAIEILAAQWERWPEESRFGTKLLSCHLNMGDAQQARATYELLVKRKKQAMQSASEELSEFRKKRDAEEATRKTAAESKGEAYVPSTPPKHLQQRLRRLRARAGKNPHALHFFAGSVFELEGQYAEAIESFKSAEAVQAAQRPSLYTKMGQVYYKMEDWSAAAESYIKVIDLAPNSPGARLGLARVYLKQSRFFEAGGESLAALELEYHNPAAHVVYATALIRLGKPKMAEQSLLTAIAQNLHYTQAYERLIRLYRGKLNAPEKADQYKALAKVAEQKRADLLKAPSADEAERLAFPAVKSVLNRINPEDGEPLIVVSGLPRSGTSLMMQMLNAGGIDMVTDRKRAADESNPKGYFEDERVKRLALDADTSWLQACRSQAIKIVAPLLGALPSDLPIKVIFMQRPAEEVLGSQRTMLNRDGKQGASTSDESVARVFSQQLDAVNRLIQMRPNIELLAVNYADAVNQPEIVAEAVNAFLARDLLVQEMQTVADPDLYRVRATH